VERETPEQPQIGTILRTIVLAVLLMVLPAVAWSLFGWLHLLLPLLGLVLPTRYGRVAGGRMLFTAAAIALVVHVPLRSLDSFIFSFTLLLCGYVLAISARRGEGPAESGLKGSLALAASWAAASLILSIGAEMSPYGRLQSNLDEGLRETQQYYRESALQSGGEAAISADNLLLIDSTLDQLRQVVKVILPAMLGSAILLLVWFSMVLGNHFLARSGGTAPWPDYRYWQLPERLVWLLILSALFALMPVPLLRQVGMNAVILLGLVYCLQGLAITIYFMNKWNVPVLFRAFFYVMIIFQSLGTLVLLIVGIAENWVDFRKLKKKEDQQLP
jgi:hypothetical protein